MNTYQLGFWNFCSHFMGVQIFQIETLALLLSFYPHPNISYKFTSDLIFVGVKMNTSFFNSVSKKGPVELF